MRIHEVVNVEEAPLDIFKRGAAAAKAFMQKPGASTAPAAPAAQPGFKLKNGVKYQGYTYNAQTNQWVDGGGNVAKGMLARQFNKKFGANDSGEPLGTSIGQKISQKLGGPFAQGLDPKAGIAQKIGAKIGSALGRAAAAIVRPKDANGDGQPDAAPEQPAAQQPQAPKPGQGDTRQGAVQVDQDLGNIVNQMRAYQPKQGAKPLPTQMAQGVMKDLANVRNNKDWAVMTGSKILKFANAGYDVADLHKKWSQEVAVGKKQKIMQDQFSEELEVLKKLAGI